MSKNNQSNNTVKEEQHNQKFWNDKELIDLYTLKTKNNLNYLEIAKKLNRSFNSVRQQFRFTNWENFFSTRKINTKKSAITQKTIDNAFTDNLIKSMVEICRHDPKRLEEITKDQFFKSVKLESRHLPLTFTELKKKALYELEQIGACYPSSKIYGKGTYIICGDTHGKHTRSGMFHLLENFSNFIKADRIIHIGHYIDDDNTANFYWDKFKNLTIVAKEEELRFLSKMNLKHEIVNKEIILGEKLSIQNQDLITDYIQTPLSRAITPEYFESSIITNLHRHEYDTRCNEQNIFSCVSSPGCLCDNHIIYTIKQQDFTDGRTVKQTFPTGYKKYRRMQHMYKTWQNGIIVVHVDSKGDFSIVMCRIQKTSKGFTTSYFDKIITEKEILDPDEKSIVNSDMHCDLHDCDILDITEQICKDYKPDVHVNLGDLSNNTSINHHIFKQVGGMRVKKSILEESATNYFVLKRMSNWAKRRILLLGNHERFYEDFYLKFPQFEDMLNFKFINGISSESIEVLNLKEIKRISNVGYIHGDLIMMGQTGSHKLDKIFRTYGKNIIIGHCHYPSQRSDCYTIGLSGRLNLQYNEINASKWTHSIGLVNTFENTAFITNVCIVNNKTNINGKIYIPVNPRNWMVPQVRVKLTFDFYGEPKHVSSKSNY